MVEQKSVAIGFCPFGVAIQFLMSQQGFKGTRSRPWAVSRPGREASCRDMESMS